MKQLEKAVEEGRDTLSEYESKELLRDYDIPTTHEIEVYDHEGFLEACREIRYPLVIKGSSSQFTHKTEHGLIRVDVRDDHEADTAYHEILSNMKDKGNALLVQEMVKGSRELMVGMTRDPQFGSCVMFGLGGIFTEILQDVSFRVAPIEKRDALEMMQEIKAHRILDEIRGLPAADLDQLSRILVKVGGDRP